MTTALLYGTGTLLYGTGTALPLVVGAAAGLRCRLPPRLLAALMAFGAGFLVAFSLA